MRRFAGMRVNVAYPGLLGVTTEKGQQDVKPNVLDAPTESENIMYMRWMTGVFEVGALSNGYVPPIVIDPDEPDPEVPAETMLARQGDGSVLVSNLADTWQPLLTRQSNGSVTVSEQ